MQRCKDIQEGATENIFATALIFSVSLPTRSLDAAAAAAAATAASGVCSAKSKPGAGDSRPRRQKNPDQPRAAAATAGSQQEREREGRKGGEENLQLDAAGGSLLKGLLMAINSDGGDIDDCQPKLPLVDGKYTRA